MTIFNFGYFQAKFLNWSKKKNNISIVWILRSKIVATQIFRPSVWNHALHFSKLLAILILDCFSFFNNFSGNFRQKSTLCLRFLMHLGILASHSTSVYALWIPTAFLKFYFFLYFRFYLSFNSIPQDIFTFSTIFTVTYGNLRQRSTLCQYFFCKVIPQKVKTLWLRSIFIPFFLLSLL